MIKTCAALLWIFAGAASASPTHTVEFRITDGSEVFVHTLAVPAEGDKASYVGNLSPIAGEWRRRAALNAFVDPPAEGSKKNNVAYNLALNGIEGGAKAATIQAEGSLIMRRGERIAVAACGRWKVTIALDAEETEDGEQPAMTRWNAQPENYRLSADIRMGAAHSRCVIVSALGYKCTNVTGRYVGDVRHGLIWWAELAAGKTPGALTLDYTLEDSEDGRATPVKSAAKVELKLGSKAALDVKGATVEVLLEGRPAKPKT